MHFKSPLPARTKASIADIRQNLIFRAKSENHVFLKKIFEEVCHDRGLNRGPLDLQPNALPTELSGSP
jgi:hypothetical protein